MANIFHSAISDPDIHEPKGIASASSGEVYVADGVGSGSWAPVLDMYSGVITDISTAEVIYVPVVNAGAVVKVVTVLEGAISVADATVTVKQAGGTTTSTITVTQSGSAAGDIDTAAPITNNTVSADSFVTVETDGASTGSARLFFTIAVERST